MFRSRLVDGLRFQLGITDWPLVYRRNRARSTESTLVMVDELGMRPTADRGEQKKTKIEIRRRKKKKKFDSKMVFKHAENCAKRGLYRPLDNRVRVSVCLLIAIRQVTHGGVRSSLLKLACSLNQTIYSDLHDLPHTSHRSFLDRAEVQAIAKANLQVG